MISLFLGVVKVLADGVQDLRIFGEGGEKTRFTGVEFPHDVGDLGIIGFLDVP